MNENICYKNHDKIVKIYKFLQSSNGKKVFKEKIKMLNENRNDVLIILKHNWQIYSHLIKTIKDICKKIIKNRLVGMITMMYVKNICAKLDRIHNANDLHKFIYEVINHTKFYNIVVWFYGILSDKSKCIKLFRS